MSEFKCGCETGSREHFIGIITFVINKAEQTARLEKIKPNLPADLYGKLLGELEKLDCQAWGALVRLGEGGEMTVGSNLFPQDEAWARAHIGKPLHFILTQLPKQGGLSLDVHEL